MHTLLPGHLMFAGQVPKLGGPPFCCPTFGCPPFCCPPFCGFGVQGGGVHCGPRGTACVPWGAVC